LSSVGTTHIAKRALVIWLKFSDDPFGCSSQNQPEEDINPLVKCDSHKGAMAQSFTKECNAKSNE
jgi:hypothetical protein